MNDNHTVRAVGILEALADLPSAYAKPEVSVFSAQTLEQTEMQLVTGDSQVLGEDGDYYY